jgi:hypothetical protein
MSVQCILPEISPTALDAIRRSVGIVTRMAVILLDDEPNPKETVTHQVAMFFQAAMSAATATNTPHIARGKAHLTVIDGGAA